VCFVVTEAVGQLSIDTYAGEPSNSSACIHITMPDVIGTEEEFSVRGSVSKGTVNALSFDVDGIGIFSLTQCDLRWINESYDLGLSHGTYAVTLVDWTDDPSCSLLVEHTLVVADPITELNVSTLPDVAVSNETEIELTAWVVDGTGVLVSADYYCTTITTVRGGAVFWCQLTGVTAVWR